jgi:hypothetical protein
MRPSAEVVAMMADDCMESSISAVTPGYIWSNAMRLTAFKALTFDCYGTLVDWESGIIEALKPLTDRVDATLGRNAILEAHARHESKQQSYTPGKKYCDLLAVVYKRLAEEWGVKAGFEECETYGKSIRQWPVFADSVGALAYLKRHYKLPPALDPFQLFRRALQFERASQASGQVAIMVDVVLTI